MPGREVGYRMTKPIRKWVICIAGFLQDEGTPHGIVQVWRDLHARHAAPNIRVEFRSWDDRTAPLAELIWRLRPPRKQPHVTIAAYSWGGASAQRLARDLARRGIVVSEMVLSDAVYRHGYWLGNWRALVPWSKITIPANVRRVTWFRQTVDRPRGHSLVPADPTATEIAPATVYQVGHTYMDDLTAFHQAAHSAAEAA